MPFTEDLAAFFDPAEFASAATYTPAGGSAATVNGIFDNGFADPLGIEGGAPRFTCVAADVAGVAHGDALAVDGTTYRVVGVEPDGTGLVALKLQEQ